MTGTDITGLAPLGKPDATLGMTPPGLVIGTLVVKRLSEREIVTGTDIIGVAPLAKPDAALAMTPPGLVMGTFVLIVVSDWGTTTGTDTIDAGLECWVSLLTVIAVDVLPGMIGASDCFEPET